MGDSRIYTGAAVLAFVAAALVYAWREPDEPNGIPENVRPPRTHESEELQAIGTEQPVKRQRLNEVAPDANPQPPPAPTQDSAPDAQADVAKFPVAGHSPVPTGGKPVAPVDLSWEINPVGTSPDEFILNLTISPLSSAKSLEVRVQGSDGVRAIGESSRVFDSPKAGQTLLFSCQVAADGNSAEMQEALVTLKMRGYDVRGRIVAIELPTARNRELRAQPATPSIPRHPEPDEILEGEQLIQDESGRALLLQPSSK
jgi:hypothetical protein